VTLSSRPLARAWMRRLTLLPVYSRLYYILHLLPRSNRCFVTSSCPASPILYIPRYSIYKNTSNKKNYKWSITKVHLLLRVHGVAHSGNASESSLPLYARRACLVSISEVPVLDLRSVGRISANSDCFIAIYPSTCTDRPGFDSRRALD